MTPEQRAVLRRICSAPERGSFEPEDCLIAFKLGLVDAANDARIRPGPERNDLLSKLVTAYIEEFYRSARDSPSAKRVDGQERAAPGP